jgi:hypothetical protein
VVIGDDALIAVAAVLSLATTAAVVEGVAGAVVALAAVLTAAAAV